MLEVGYLLQSHTDGDVYALFRDANVLYTGPAIRADSWAVVDENSNGFIGGITDAYDTLGSIINEQSVIVPASGNILNKNEFDALDTMYQSLKAEMVSLLRQSRGPEEVVIVNPAQGLQPGWGDPSEFLDKGFRSFLWAFKKRSSNWRWFSLKIRTKRKEAIGKVGNIKID